MAVSEPATKRFRFDSFATEFASSNSKEEVHEDNDSGIGEFVLWIKSIVNTLITTK